MGPRPFSSISRVLVGREGLGKLSAFVVVSRSVGLLRAALPAPRRQPSADLRLFPLATRLVKRPPGQRLRQVALGDIVAAKIVRILVPLAVAEFAHELGRGVA